jgi:hypothetical protein
MGKPGLELGDPRDLARDQHPAVHQQGGAALLHHLEALGLQVGPARWGQVQLGPGREGDFALAPGPGVDQQRQAAASGAGGQALQAAVVVDVAVGDDDGPQPGRVDLHDLQVVAKAPRGHAAVVQDRAALPARLDGDQGREPVLGHQLLAVEGVVGQRDRRTPSAPASRMSTTLSTTRMTSTASTGCNSTMRGSLPYPLALGEVLCCWKRR